MKQRIEKLYVELANANCEIGDLKRSLEDINYNCSHLDVTCNELQTTLKGEVELRQSLQSEVQKLKETVKNYVLSNHKLSEKQFVDYVFTMFPNEQFPKVLATKFIRDQFQCSLEEAKAIVDKHNRPNPT